MESWSKDKKSNSLLKHEQLHFDIAELTTRKLRQAYSTHVSYDIEATSLFIDSVFNRYSKIEFDSINALYDTETNHGIIETKQKVWETKITSELKKLEKYASTKVVIKRVVKN
jgi:hypothetical protein